MSFKVWQGTVEVYDEETCDYMFYEGTGFFALKSDAQFALDAIVKPHRPRDEMICEVTWVQVRGDVADLTDDSVEVVASGQERSDD